MPGGKSIAMGYMRAHKRQRKAYSKAYALYPDKDLDDSTAEEIWIELFEELAGRSTALTRGAARMEPELCTRRELPADRGAGAGGGLS